MKIGILTLHSNTNFGGGLQQIAMFETLKSLGHEPRFLCVVNNTKLSAPRHLVGIMSSYSCGQLVLAVKEGFKRITEKKSLPIPNYEISKKTDDFNYSVLNYTPKFNVEELSQYASDCDAIICGSDQVWTDVYSGVLPYFCDAMPDFKGKRIAFAVCSAHNRVPIYNRAKIKKLLSDFDAIYVRDRTTEQLVKRCSKIDAQIVCDPTLLYDFKSYLKPSPISGPYIFVYVLGDKPAEWHQRNLDKIKAETDVTKVVVLTASLDEKYSWADIVITDALAVDWMNILRESDFVYTNSFHAVIFSLKFHRQFVAYYGDVVRSSRMRGLREQLELSNRIVKNPQLVDYKSFISFDKYDDAIGSIAQSSLTYLRSALKS